MPYHGTATDQSYGANAGPYQQWYGGVNPDGSQQVPSSFGRATAERTILQHDDRSQLWCRGRRNSAVQSWGHSKQQSDLPYYGTTIDSNYGNNNGISPLYVPDPNKLPTELNTPVAENTNPFVQTVSYDGSGGSQLAGTSGGDNNAIEAGFNASAIPWTTASTGDYNYVAVNSNDLGGYGSNANPFSLGGALNQDAGGNAYADLAGANSENPGGAAYTDLGSYGQNANPFDGSTNPNMDVAAGGQLGNYGMPPSPETPYVSAELQTGATDPGGFMMAPGEVPNTFDAQIMDPATNWETNANIQTPETGIGSLDPSQEGSYSFVTVGGADAAPDRRAWRYGRGPDRDRQLRELYLLRR